MRKHASSGQWIILGSEYCQPFAGFNQASYSWIGSLANPSALDKTSSGQRKNPKFVKQNGHSVSSNIYFSFFDASGAQNVGENFETVNDYPLLIVVDDDRSGISHQYIKITYHP